MNEAPSLQFRTLKFRLSALESHHLYLLVLSLGRVVTTTRRILATFHVVYVHHKLFINLVPHGSWQTRRQSHFLQKEPLLSIQEHESKAKEYVRHRNHDDILIWIGGILATVF